MASRGLDRRSGWRLALLGGAVGLSLGGCRTGQGPPRPRPGIDTGQTCLKAVPNPKFLLVHWGEEERKRLDAVMATGLAVVSAGCDRVRLLPDCHVEGLYQYFGTTPATQRMTLPWSEQRVNLAFGGEAAGVSEEAVNVTVLRVGRMVTTRKSADRSLLNGQCEGATHFIRSASVGSSAVHWPGATRRSASDVAFVLERCKDAEPTAALPPRRCRDLVRVELVALDGAAPAPDDPFHNCPRGWAFGQGKCAPRAGHTAFDCTGGRDECWEQCRRGSAASCNRLGALLVQDEGASRADQESAGRYFAAACGMGYAPGCFNLGAYAYSAHTDPDAHLSAPDLWARACLGGHALGCANLGVLFARGDRVPQDEGRALEYFVRACIGGDDGGCLDAGFMCRKRDDPGDEKRAFLMFTLACEGGNLDGCDQAVRVINEMEGS